MSGLLVHLRNHYGPEAFTWFDVPYVADWLLTTALWFFSGYIDRLQVFERQFSLNDPVISHPHKKQQISGYTNNAVALLVPLTFVLTSSLLKRSLIDLHHGALGLCVSRSLSHFLTEFLKNRVGRLRPDFLDRCKWDEAVNQCTGKLKNIVDGRKSFPSGHSSTAFSGMTFLFLWFSAHTAAWSFAEALPLRGPRILASRICRLLVTLSPLMFATWVAISRIEDHRHHKEDVIVGSILGIASAFIGYLAYWPNPFSSRHHREGVADKPRILYGNESLRANSNDLSGGGNYELARLEEGSA